jgi:septum formation protein
LVILASSSPTRAGLLRDFGIEFDQRTVDFDEDAIAATNPAEFVYIATDGKMKAAKSAFGLGTPIICADTVVSVDGVILRKAFDETDARRLLALQSGEEVDIITCTILAKNGFELIDTSVTSYIFGKFDDEATNEYIASGDWRGKAGAIMVEGFAKPYIKSVVGYESCAMGLSVEKLLPFL